MGAPHVRLTFAVVAAVIVLAAALVAAAVYAGDVRPRDRAAAPRVTSRPDPAVTPGVILPDAAREDVCHLGWARAHRRGLTPRQELYVLVAYRLVTPAEAATVRTSADVRGLVATRGVAEWDHLVSLELGGANGPRNIWPQLDPAEKTRKDALENRLHREVCAGRLNLGLAQDEVRVFWEYW